MGMGMGMNMYHIQGDNYFIPNQYQLLLTLDNLFNEKHHLHSI